MHVYVNIVPGRRGTHSRRGGKKHLLRLGDLEFSQVWHEYLHKRARQTLLRSQYISQGESLQNRDHPGIAVKRWVSKGLEPAKYSYK